MGREYNVIGMMCGVGGAAEVAWPFVPGDVQDTPTDSGEGGAPAVGVLHCDRGGMALHQPLGPRRPHSSGPVDRHMGHLYCALRNTRSLQPFHTTCTFVRSFSGCEIENSTAHLGGAVARVSGLGLAITLRTVIIIF